MPALPLIDTLIFLGWSSIMVAFILKAIDISTRYRASVFGLNAHDFLLASGIFLLFALTLAARTWVKANEPRMLRERWRRLREESEPFHGWNGEPARVEAEPRATADPDLEPGAPPAPVRIRAPISST